MVAAGALQAAGGTVAPSGAGWGEAWRVSLPPQESRGTALAPGHQPDAREPGSLARPYGSLRPPQTPSSYGPPREPRAPHPATTTPGTASLPCSSRGDVAPRLSQTDPHPARSAAPSSPGRRSSCRWRRDTGPRFCRSTRAHSSHQTGSGGNLGTESGAAQRSGPGTHPPDLTVIQQTLPGPLRTSPCPLGTHAPENNTNNVLPVHLPSADAGPDRR